MTTREYFQLPEGPPYFQLIDGELYMSPSPRRYHQRIATSLAHSLYAHVEDHALGEIYIAPSDVTLADDAVLNPDLYFVSRDRAHILTDQGCDGAPDLVIEILSPSTAKLDLGRKREIYAASGVRELWIVAPEPQLVEIYRTPALGGDPVAVLREGDAVTSPVLPGLSLPVAAIFKR